ncbi:unnamed protein product, partial [Iphiclides podalirius]
MMPNSARGVTGRPSNAPKVWVDPIGPSPPPLREEAYSLPALRPRSTWKTYPRTISGQCTVIGPRSVSWKIKET